MTVWDFVYDQSITTFNQQAALGLGVPSLGGGSLNTLGSVNTLLAAQNPTLSPDVIQQNSAALLGLAPTGSFFGPTNFLTNRLFLQKTLQASVAMNGSRNSVVLRVFNMTRQAFSAELLDEANLVGPNNAAFLNHTQQSGANALWSYRLSQLTRANVNFAYTRFKFLGTDRTDDLMFIMAGLSKQFQLQPNLSGAIQVRHQQRNSNQPGPDYREEAVIGSLNMSF